MPNITLNDSYLMEGPAEDERLQFKDNSQATLFQLMQTGINDLGDAPYVIDAGTGVGVVAYEMANVISSSYHDAQLTLLDGSAQRLNVANQKLEKFKNIKKNFLTCSLEQIPIPDNTADYIFCRFVFEYLANPQSVFNELTRILKPNGKLVIGDLDLNCLNHYPMPEALMKKMFELVSVIEQSKLLDFYAGRKLYHYFYQAGYKDIRVHFHAHHLFYGDLPATDRDNWSMKLDRLINLQNDSKLSFSFDLNEFKASFMDFLDSPERFSYTPLIIVEGLKP